MNVLTNGRPESKPKTPTGETDSFFDELLLLERKQMVERLRKMESELLKRGLISRRMVLLRSTN